MTIDDLTDVAVLALQPFSFTGLGLDKNRSSHSRMRPCRAPSC